MISALLTSHWFLIAWIVLAAASLVVSVRDLLVANRGLPSLMRGVWLLTVLYSGPLGLAAYSYAGRRQIPEDTLGRRGLRSVAHCCSGCGAGEVVGVALAAGIFSLRGWWVAGITFVLASVFGYALTVGPLVQGGERIATALRDTLYSETASITVMEVTAIAVDLPLAKNATIGEPLFWSSLVFSLSMGPIAAYPVNVLLVRFGVKAGMHDPRHSEDGRG